MGNTKNFMAFSILLGILILLTILNPLGQQSYVAARTSDDSDSNDNSDHSSDSGSGSHSGIVDSACRMINKHPFAANLLGHVLGLGPAGPLAQGYCELR